MVRQAAAAMGAKRCPENGTAGLAPASKRDGAPAWGSTGWSICYRAAGCRASCDTTPVTSPPSSPPAPQDDYKELVKHFLSPAERP